MVKQRLLEMQVDQSQRAKKNLKEAQAPFIPRSIHGPNLLWDDAVDNLVELMLNSAEQKVKFFEYEELLSIGAYVRLHGAAHASDIFPARCSTKSTMKAALRDVLKSFPVIACTHRDRENVVLIDAHNVKFGTAMYSSFAFAGDKKSSLQADEHVFASAVAKALDDEGVEVLSDDENEGMADVVAVGEESDVVVNGVVPESKGDDGKGDGEAAQKRTGRPSILSMFPDIVDESRSFLAMRGHKAQARRRSGTGTTQGVTMKELMTHLMKNIFGLNKFGISMDELSGMSFCFSWSTVTVKGMN
jgi:hypothetical protein